MDKPILGVILFLMCSITAGIAQKKNSFDLAKLLESKQLEVLGRDATVFSEAGKKGIALNEGENDGVVWLKGVTFANGTIELDIKGRDQLQQSFLGVAFHGLDNQTTDVVYFRPFNFQSTDAARKIHMVQYVSPPEYDWKKLREEQNGKYEKGISPAPGSNDWFHAKIVVHAPHVTVFVNGNTEPSLTVDKLNTRKDGKLGLWVGVKSDAHFANLVVTSE